MFNFFVSAAASVAAPYDDRGGAVTAEQRSTHDAFTMGFEVETSGIKVQHLDEDEILVILESIDGTWQLTTDTQDKRIDSTNWVNLECRTVGGLTQEEIKKYIAITQKVMRKIKEICDAATDGQVCFNSSFLNTVDLAQEGLYWGSSDAAKRKLDKVTFATKRKITDSAVEKIKLMTACDECLEVFAFTASDNTIGIEVKLAHGKHLDNASEKITQFAKKLTDEFNTMAKITGAKGWQLDNISIVNLYGNTLNEHLFKPCLLLGTILTFSTEGVFSSLDCTLRPQLTFSFPLRRMQQIFSILNRNEASAPRLLRIQETLDKPLPRFGRSEESSRRERIAGFQKLDILKKLLTSSQVDDAGGLCWLVTSYIYELFVLNHMPRVNSETGPKAFLKVVSRVPFSAIYEQLTSSEQAAFINFCECFPQDLMDALIKPYRKDVPESTYETTQDAKGTYITDLERISLIEWLASILDPDNRFQSSEVVVMRDLLSPPPYTAKSYSMGAVEISKINRRFALLEARGYAGMPLHSILSEGKINISLDNIEKLINGEADVFFKLRIGD